MNVRVFFLRKEGWFETEIEGKLKSASMEVIVMWAYTMTDRHHYRNYLITENPGPVLAAVSDQLHPVSKYPASSIQHPVTHVSELPFIL